MKRFFAVFFALSAVIGFTAPVACSAVGVSASSAILTEAQSGDTVFEKDAYTRRWPASTTKIMTGYIALRYLDMNTVIKTDPAAVGVEGSSVYLKAGEMLTAEELVYALLLESANDAAAAIAYAVSGSIESFAELMNSECAALGLSDTHFTNPHGLHDSGHYTTAHDLSVITAAALRTDGFAQIVGTGKITFDEPGGGHRTFVNHNRLLYLYNGACGVKTGFTKASGRCLVSCACRNGVTLIAVTLNAPDDWNDHRAMLDYGFSLYESVSLCSAGEYSFSIPVRGCGQNIVIRAENTDGVSAVFRRGGAGCRVSFEMPEYLTAPVKYGDTAGYAVFTDSSGRERARVEIKTCGSADTARPRGFFKKTAEFFLRLKPIKGES